MGTIREKINRICETCGKEYQASKGKYCSANCWGVANGRRFIAEGLERKCIHCGEIYKTTTMTPNKKYCSRKCFEKHSIKRVLYARHKGHKRRVKIRFSVIDSKPMNNWITELSLKKKHNCYWCGKSVTSKNMQIDHINPVSKGGRHNISNVCISCRKCNINKSNKDLNTWTSTTQGQMRFAM